MSTQPRTMITPHPVPLHGGGLASEFTTAPSASGASGDSLWDGPTLRELVDNVEHQFGETPGLFGVFALGFGNDEPLTPGDVQAVCDHLGLPAEDFGIDP